MKSDKNIFKSASFFMITILFLSLAYIKIYSPISTNLKMIASYEDFSSEEEISDSEESLEDEYLDIFILESKNITLVDFCKYFPKIQSIFLIPKIFLDIQLLPPEA
jgi:hypothetical protein